MRLLADRLIGTIGIGMQDDLNDLTAEECRQLDTLAFCCVGCEWWHTKIGFVDLPRGWFCQECAREIQADTCLP